MLAHVTWTQDAQTLAVAMNSVATVDRMDEVSGRLRLKKAMASWHFTTAGRWIGVDKQRGPHRPRFATTGLANK